MDSCINKILQVHFHILTKSSIVMTGKTGRWWEHYINISTYINTQYQPYVNTQYYHLCLME